MDFVASIMHYYDNDLTISHYERDLTIKSFFEFGDGWYVEHAGVVTSLYNTPSQRIALWRFLVRMRAYLRVVGFAVFWYERDIDAFYKHIGQQHLRYGLAAGDEGHMPLPFGVAEASMARVYREAPDYRRPHSYRYMATGLEESATAYGYAVVTSPQFNLVAPMYNATTPLRTRPNGLWPTTDFLELWHMRHRFDQVVLDELYANWARAHPPVLFTTHPPQHKDGAASSLGPEDLARASGLILPALNRVAMDNQRFAHDAGMVVMRAAIRDNAGEQQLCAGVPWRTSLKNYFQRADPLDTSIVLPDLVEQVHAPEATTIVNVTEYYEMYRLAVCNAMGSAVLGEMPTTSGSVKGGKGKSSSGSRRPTTTEEVKERERARDVQLRVEHSMFNLILKRAHLMAFGLNDVRSLGAAVDFFEQAAAIYDGRKSHRVPKRGLEAMFAHELESSSSAPTTTKSKTKAKDGEKKADVTAARAKEKEARKERLVDEAVKFESVIGSIAGRRIFTALARYRAKVKATAAGGGPSAIDVDELVKIFDREEHDVMEARFFLKNMANYMRALLALTQYDTGVHRPDVARQWPPVFSQPDVPTDKDGGADGDGNGGDAPSHPEFAQSLTEGFSGAGASSVTVRIVFDGAKRANGKAEAEEEEEKVQLSPQDVMAFYGAGTMDFDELREWLTKHGVAFKKMKGPCKPPQTAAVPPVDKNKEQPKKGEKETTKTPTTASKKRKREQKETTDEKEPAKKKKKKTEEEEEGEGEKKKETDDAKKSAKRKRAESDASSSDDTSESSDEEKKKKKKKKKKDTPAKKKQKTSDDK